MSPGEIRALIASIADVDMDSIDGYVIVFHQNPDGYRVLSSSDDIKPALHMLSAGQLTIISNPQVEISINTGQGDTE